MRMNSVAAPLLALTALALLAMLCCLGGCGDNGNGPGNESPAITSLAASADTVDPTARVALTCSASDADGDALAYTWGQEAGGIAGSGASVAWTAPLAAGSYSIWVKVADGKGGEAADTTEVTVIDGVLLVQTRDGLMSVTMSGTSTLFYDNGGEVEVLGDRVFIGPSGTTIEINRDGDFVRSIPRPAQIPGAITFVVLPDAGFAFVNNNNDSIYFMSPAGGFVTAGPVPTPSPSGWQSTGGLVVGDRLIMADSGPNQVYAWDLVTHEGSVLRDLSGQVANAWDLDYSDGIFYVACQNNIYRFTETGDVEPVCTPAPGYMVSVAVVGSYAYGTRNAAGEIWKVNIYTGEYDVFLDGLDYPMDIEFLRLEP